MEVSSNMEISSQSQALGSGNILNFNKEVTSSVPRILVMTSFLSHCEHSVAIFQLLFGRLLRHFIPRNEAQLLMCKSELSI